MTAGGYRVTSMATAATDDASGRRSLVVRLEVEGPACAVEGTAAVPLGADADGDAMMTGAVAALLAGRRWRSFGHLDDALGDLAAAAAPERPEARAVLGVSVAAARAFAAADGLPLYRWLALAPPRLPMPRFDIVRGGRHAPNRLDFETFSIVPAAARSFAEALRIGEQVHDSLATVLHRVGFRTSLGRDAAYVPPLQAPGDVVDLLCDAIADGGHEPGRRGVAISLGVSATSLREPDGAYRVNGTHLDTVAMVEYLAHLVDHHPVVSLEEPMAKDDAEGWRALAGRLGERVQLVAGPDLVPLRAIGAGRSAHRQPAATVTIEVGRARTVSELLDAARRWDARGMGVLVSARAVGADPELAADFAVATGCGQLASGPPAGGPPSVTYGRLRVLEAGGRSDGHPLPYAVGGQ